MTQSALAQAKGLYYNGLAYEFLFQNYNSGQDLRVDARFWNASDNSWDLKWFQDWGIQPVDGSLGACVFKGSLYCFFTTTDYKLKYVTINPVSQHMTGPTMIAQSIGSVATITSGAAAAVCGGAIYVFTPRGYGFMSQDGTNFTTWTYAVPGMSGPKWILDAVTLYPVGGKQASIMLAYDNADNPPRLCASIFSPPNQTAVQSQVLPWPPVAPCLWGPVAEGNLVLGTSGTAGFGQGATAPCVQFYGYTQNNSCDGQHLGRWEYNVASQKWSFSNWTQGGSIYKLAVWPWFDTMDANSGMMRLSHCIDVQYGNTETWYVNRSDWMVPQNHDPVYGWDGTPTATSTATGDTDQARMLRSLWTLVGFVLGPPPFALNGATDGSSLSQVQYGIEPEPKCDHNRDEFTDDQRGHE